MSGSSKKQEPKIVRREELETESKWMKLEKIHWEDQEGKAVSSSFLQIYSPTLLREDGRSLDLVLGKLFGVRY